MNTSDVAENTIAEKNSKSEILVSVLAPAYNHEDWIARAIESFIEQKTPFPIEILIHDDASTDSTAEIIREYENKYPGLVKGIYQKNNQLSKGNHPIFILSAMAKGKYLAVCECDDYWTDPLKLQKQIALLEAHPECSMCVAQTDVFKLENGHFRYQQTYRGIDGVEKDLIFINDLCNGALFHTSTHVFQKKLFDSTEEYWSKIRYSDTARCFILIDNGPFVVLHETVSVYQITGKGIYTSLNNYEKASGSILLFESLYRFFKPKYRSFYSGILTQYYMTLLISDIRKLRLRYIFNNCFRFAFLGMRYAPIQTLKMIAGRTVRYIKNEEQ